MKKISLIVKETAENRIKTNIDSTKSFFVIKYSGLSSFDMCTLRMNLKAVGSEVFVVKNTTAKKVLKDYLGGELVKLVDGPCGIVFFKDDLVGVSKVLYDFSKSKEKLNLAGGLLIDKAITKSDIEKLAKLPTKDVLRGLVVGALKSPIVGLVMVLNGNLRKIVTCLDQIKQKKSTQSG